MTEAESTHPLEWFIDALLQSTGQLMLIIDHMSRHPSDDPESRFDDALRGLLSETLEPIYKRRDPRDLAAAAAVLVETGDAIGEGLFLVDPDPGGINGNGGPER